MRKFLTFNVMLLCFLLFAGCASVAGNYPVRNVPQSRATITGLNPEFANAPILCEAVYNGKDSLNFFQYKHGWLDPTEALERSAKKMHQDSGGMPIEDCYINMRSMPKYQWLFALQEQNLVVYEIGVDTPKDLKVHFNGRGSLTFTLASNQEVSDVGVLIPQIFDPISDWHDSRRQVATLSRDSNNGRPSGVPNILFVLMPKSSYGQRVLKVTPTKGMSFSGHASLALK